MFKKRFTKRATNFRSFRRSGPRLHAPTKPRIWQRANFYFTQSQTFDDAQGLDPQNTVLVLGQIDDRVGDSSTGVGRAQAELWKYLDIGGIVMDWSMYASIENEFDGSLLEDQFELHSQLLLCVDRLDNVSNPVAVACNWFNNTTPVSLASGQTTEDEDNEYPTRVLWRAAAFHRPPWVPHALTGGQPTTNVGALNGHNVVLGSGRINKRLKLRIDDQHQLNLHLTGKANLTPAADVSRSLRFAVVGSLYYRFSAR